MTDRPRCSTRRPSPSTSLSASRIALQHQRAHVGPGGHHAVLRAHWTASCDRGCSVKKQSLLRRANLQPDIVETAAALAASCASWSPQTCTSAFTTACVSQDSEKGPGPLTLLATRWPWRALISHAVSSRQTSTCPIQRGWICPC